MGIKGNVRDCAGNRKMFCSHVTIFVVRCTTVLQDVTIRENLVKDYTRSLCIIPYNCM